MSEVGGAAISAEEVPVGASRREMPNGAGRNDGAQRVKGVHFADRWRKYTVRAGTVPRLLAGVLVVTAALFGLAVAQISLTFKNHAIGNSFIRSAHRHEPIFNFFVFRIVQ